MYQIDRHARIQRIEKHAQSHTLTHPRLSLARETHARNPSTCHQFNISTLAHARTRNAPQTTSIAKTEKSTCTLRRECVCVVSVCKGKAIY